jgi:predicted Zn-dependent protease
MCRWAWLALALLPFTAACTASSDEEVAMGKADAAKVESELPIVHDTVVERFVNTLGRSIASRTSRADLDWHFAVVNTPEVNAFALPGGFIYVDRGLIERADRLDQLAGVMGHEVGHVVRRHSVQQMKESQRHLLGLVLLCTLTRVCSSVGGRVAVDVGSDALTARYSQRDEAQADSEGVRNSVRAGIDPEGLPSFFQKLLDEQKEQPSAVEAFFSTHPTDQSRIDATQQQIGALDPGQLRGLVRDTPEFHAVQERIRALPAEPPAPTP